MPILERHGGDMGMSSPPISSRRSSSATMPWATMLSTSATEKRRRTRPSPACVVRGREAGRSCTFIVHFIHLLLQDATRRVPPILAIGVQQPPPLGTPPLDAKVAGVSIVFDHQRFGRTHAFRKAGL